ncbi:MAG: saccharopine dehydrogenase C-terminal domain-containing protein [Candidatus Thermoplasmatota archaeon]|nr:saccharopine dehydrogenase C-terminal domain-containing protein [Candidatus Thermoplasmatota archaeon]
MNVVVLGAGMMGRAITYDLSQLKTFDQVTLVDKSTQMLQDSLSFLSTISFETAQRDVSKIESIKDLFLKADIVISAIPYTYNYDLTQLAIKTKTHFIDLGGNNDIVNKQRSLHEQAKKQEVTIIPDSGLAPGLVSVITRDIVDSLSEVEAVQLRVGGLPLHPQPPLDYQIVFSLNGLINEYIEDTLILENGSILSKPSMTGLESIKFPAPFSEMEAFYTSGGCSTLPYTYKEKIKHLDYKTIRYPGHCNRFKTLLDIGLGSIKPIEVQGQLVMPRDILIELLNRSLPSVGPDVVLLKVIGNGIRKDTRTTVEYTMIDTYDEKNDLSAMMRTTGFPVSITADFIAQGIIRDHGVFCPEEIIPPTQFFKELGKRDIIIKKTEVEKP